MTTANHSTSRAAASRRPARQCRASARWRCASASDSATVAPRGGEFLLHFGWRRLETGGGEREGARASEDGLEAGLEAVEFGQRQRRDQPRQPVGRRFGAGDAPAPRGELRADLAEVMLVDGERDLDLWLEYDGACGEQRIDGRRT